MRQCPVLYTFLSLIRSKSHYQSTHDEIWKLLQDPDLYCEPEETHSRALLVLEIIRYDLLPDALHRANTRAPLIWVDKTLDLDTVIRKTRGEFAVLKAEYDLMSPELQSKAELYKRRMTEAGQVMSMFEMILQAVKLPTRTDSNYAHCAQLFFAMHEVLGATSEVFFENAEKILHSKEMK